MSFRTKIIISYLVVIAVMIAVMFPIASQTVQKVIYNTMYERVYALIEKIEQAPDEDALIQRLKDQKPLIFFRVSLITSDRHVLYDSYTKRLLGPRFNKNITVNHPEVEQAFKEGYGSKEGYSKLLDQSFSYMALSFHSHGKEYVLRTAFPFNFIEEMTREFEEGFIGLSALVLLLFSTLTWLVINHMTKPIQQIITTLKPYQEGVVNSFPEIKVDVDADDDFGKLANTLNMLSVKVQKLLGMRKDFIANASHELKTPITIIRGFAETLHDHPELPPETVSEITEKIVHNCKRMGELIKDLLTLSDIENIPESRLVECDLIDLLHNCIQMVQEVFPEARIAFHQNTQEAHILADANLMELALLNLIENAAKYSPKPADIAVTLDTEGSEFKVTVADKGIGIPQKDLEHIFERFYTVNKAHSRKLGGSGLGLSIVHTIVEKHFGHITVSSQVGIGTEFRVFLKKQNTV